MGTIEPHKIIDSARKMELDPALKEVGFKRSGRVFRRWIGENCQVLDLQLSRWNTRQSSRFTINLGLYCPQIAIAQKLPPVANPSNMHCAARQRIGFLLPAERDHWWEVTPETTVDVLAKELKSTVKPALGWFEHMKTAYDAAVFLEGANYHYLAAVTYLAIGDVQKARHAIDKALQRGQETPVMMDWARSKDLL